ncbi:MAG: hypothetical protein GC208_09485 [Alphaproteobacteria bacterium]|nr:hypothetical protein [Alphaproteobacteria bacterium]
MTDRAISFSDEMVRALLDGRKTQTRRVLKHRPGKDERVIDLGAGYAHQCNFSGDYWGGEWLWPYAVGDRLWVKEAHALDPADGVVLYRATGEEPYFAEDAPVKWIIGRHMRKARSRLTLVVTEVRVQRVQDISEEDADAEAFGGDFPHDVLPELFPDADRAGELSIRQCFGRLWDSLNAKRGFGWDANPWVVAISFDVHRANIDRVAA